MTHLSETELFERLLDAEIPESQREYYERFARYTCARSDADHGINIVLNQREKGYGFTDQSTSKTWEKNYGVMQCDDMVGVSAAMLAVNEVCRLANEHQLAMVSCVSIQHVGAIGFHVNEMAERGVIGLGFLSTHAVMSYPPYSTRVVGNNLLSIGVPLRKGSNLVLDMSTGTTNVRAFVSDLVTKSKKDGSTQGVLDLALSEYALSPIGGHKGAALALAIQALVTATGGGEARLVPARMTDHCKNHVLFMGIKPIKDYVSKFLEELTEMKEKFPELYVPGQKQWN
jgi:LDH2 family malate/lactate/ureidoglycolate dehydrogenase